MKPKYTLEEALLSLEKEYTQIAAALEQLKKQIVKYNSQGIDYNNKDLIALYIEAYDIFMRMLFNHMRVVEGMSLRDEVPTIIFRTASDGGLFSNEDFLRACLMDSDIGQLKFRLPEVGNLKELLDRAGQYEMFMKQVLKIMQHNHKEMLNRYKL